MHTADTESFVNDGDRAFESCLFGQRQRIGTKERSKTMNGVIAARWADVDCCVALDNSLRIRPATGIAALCALRLRQQLIDLLNELPGVGGQASRGITQHQSGN
jgi:hypothetical protein